MDIFAQISGLLKNAHLRRSPHPSSLRRTFKYASFLMISGALHLGIFEQPAENVFFNKPLVSYRPNKPNKEKIREGRAGVSELVYCGNLLLLMNHSDGSTSPRIFWHIDVNPKSS
jgi:hypothetical protein